MAECTLAGLSGFSGSALEPSSNMQGEMVLALKSAAEYSVMELPQSRRLAVGNWIALVRGPGCRETPCP